MTNKTANRLKESLGWLGAGVAAVVVAWSLSGTSVIHRGAVIPPGSKVVPLATVIAKPAEFTQHEIVTEGTVRKVCLIGGCWMTVGAQSGEAAMHVTFRRGAFVVPRSSAGNHARLLGKVKVTDGKATFVATGVDLTAAP